MHPYWATMHPIWATPQPKSYAAFSELSCIILSYAASFWVTLHPYELYAAPYLAKIHPIYTVTKHCKKYDVPHPAHRSFAVPSGEFYDI